MTREPTGEYRVRVQPGDADPTRFRWVLVRHGEDEVLSAVSYETEEAALSMGLKRARRLGEDEEPPGHPRSPTD